jgi:phage gp46-like protein
MPGLPASSSPYYLHAETILDPPDIRTVQNVFFPKYNVTIDWSLLSDGTLDDSMALATAVVVALGTNALASVDDRLPDPDSADREGWWGDMDADVIWNGWPIGSKLWLLRRSAIESADSKWGSTQTYVMNYIQTCIQPFVDRRICTRFEVISMRVTKQQINAVVRLYRGPTAAIDLMYQALWQGIAT